VVAGIPPTEEEEEEFIRLSRAHCWGRGLPPCERAAGHGQAARALLLLLLLRCVVLMC
jgi:hypothetical protein